MSLLMVVLVVLLLVLLLGGGWGWSSWGLYGLGPFLGVLVIVLALYFLGVLH